MKCAGWCRPRSRLGRAAVRGLLWRIRTKLLLSYLFIAVVPLVLAVIFFVLAGYLGVSMVASYINPRRSPQRFRS